jgi:predicted acyl esterase
MDKDTEEISFEYTFSQKACILGSSRAVLFVSCNDSDDMDVFVQLRKADSDGRLLQHINIPLQDLMIDAKDVEPINPLKYLGPPGCLRASHAAIDETISTSSFPEHDYSSRTPVPNGKIINLNIGIWQTGIAFDAGEKLILKVSGHNMTLAEFPPLRGQSFNKNVGQHHIHFGGANQSKLIVPLVEV